MGDRSVSQIHGKVLILVNCMMSEYLGCPDTLAVFIQDTVEATILYVCIGVLYCGLPGDLVVNC